MSRRLAKLGDGTTSGGQIVSATSGFSEGSVKLVLDGDMALCPKCEGGFPIVGSAIYFSSGSDRHVADGDKVLCRCPDNVVVASTTYWVEKAAARVQPRQAVSSPAPEPVQYAQTVKARPATVAVAKAPPEPLPLPARIYTTQHLMDDMSAPDMRYKDIPEGALRNFYGLTDISTRCNPFTMADRKKSAAILFDEFRGLSDMASFYGPYQALMRQMIDHMQGNSGATFRHPLLDRAMSERIDMTEQTETLAKFQKALADNLDWVSGAYPLYHKEKLTDAVQRTKLPKFNHWTDRVNGLGITIHDTWATHITLQSLMVSGNRFSAQVHFRIQDHFGLDEADVLSPVYRQFRMFRIWFLLQHWVEYGYRPFITEMNVTKTIEGNR